MKFTFPPTPHEADRIFPERQGRPTKGFVMTKTQIMKDRDEALMVLKVAFTRLVEAVQAASNVNNALATVRHAMKRYDDLLVAVEARTAHSPWDLFKSKDLLKKNRESAREILIAARKRLAGFRGYLVNVQNSQAALCRS
jgi:hypothetical protein